MAKVPPKLYKISEVAEYSGLSKQTISYYTVLGLIRAAQRTRSRHRLYDTETFERLERIKELKKEGKTLVEIREILAEESSGQTEAGDRGKESEAES